MAEMHIARLQSDYESEKRTRAEVNRLIFEKLDRHMQQTQTIEKRIYMGIGLLIGISWLLQYIHH